MLFLVCIEQFDMCLPILIIFLLLHLFFYLPLASEHYHSYAAVVVLPQTQMAFQHPEVFLSSDDNSVVVVDMATVEIKDLHCRARTASPIVEMSFAPNGQFLACFRESSMLTVISMTFETKF